MAGDEAITFMQFIEKIAKSGHNWGEVVDFCNDAVGDPQWGHVTSITTMKEKIREKGWRPDDRNIGEAAMNTWYAFKGLRRTSER